MGIKVHMPQVLLSKLSGHTKEKAKGAMDSCITRRFTVFCTLPNSITENQERSINNRGMWHEWDRREMYTVLVDEHEGK
jgi:hypothetical protein